MTPIEKAIEAVGSPKALADKLGRSPQFIHKIRKGKGHLTTRVVSPQEWCKATGLPMTELFPEYFPSQN